MEEEINELWAMSEPDVAELVKPILAMQSGKTKSWCNEQHVELIANVAVEHGLPSTMKNKFKKSLLVNGLGGNASQFRQWLEFRGVEVKKRPENLFEKFDE